MNAALIDTSVWGAHFNRRDRLCSRAGALLSLPNLRPVTTWPIVWETVTLISRDVSSESAAVVGRRFVDGELADIVELTSTDYVMAFDLMRRFPHLRLSAAYATGCAVACRLKIETILSFDSDFATVLSDRQVLGVND